MNTDTLPGILSEHSVMATCPMRWLQMKQHHYSNHCLPLATLTVEVSVSITADWHLRPSERRASCTLTAR